MLAELGGVTKIYIAVGFTDLRLGINDLAQTIGTKYDLNPFEKGTLFLFCGRKVDRIKALLWEGDGFLVIGKPMEHLLIVVETASMNEAVLAEYARKKGLYVEQIKSWRDACMNANGGVAKESSIES